MDPKPRPTDALIKGLGVAPSSSWKKKSVACATLLLVVFIVYLIGTSISPSLQIGDRNNIINPDITSHPTGSDPFENWQQCDSIESPPELIGYHVHAMFDGNDAQSIAFAYDAYHTFIAHINADMQACEFAHSYAAQAQTEVCYFPTTYTETDYPLPSNFIFQTTNYGFYIPPQHLQASIEFWMQRHNDALHQHAFDYVLHTVSGCQLNDHTKWLLTSGGYAGDLVVENLVCCHHGPAECSCNLVQYQVTETQCLGVQFSAEGDDGASAAFVYTECEDAMHRNLGTWRELFYDTDRDWLQIENYGDVSHPMYMCLAVVGSDADDVASYCNIGTEVQFLDCSYQQDVGNDVWIAKQTRFSYDVETNQMKFIGCQEENLCVDVKDYSTDQTDGGLKLTIASCGEATVFQQRHFFP